MTIFSMKRAADSMTLAAIATGLSIGVSSAAESSGTGGVNQTTPPGQGTIGSAFIVWQPASNGNVNYCVRPEVENDWPDATIGLVEVTLTKRKFEQNTKFSKPSSSQIVFIGKTTLPTSIAARTKVKPSLAWCEYGVAGSVPPVLTLTLSGPGTSKTLYQQGLSKTLPYAAAVSSTANLKQLLGINDLGTSFLPQEQKKD